MPVVLTIPCCAQLARSGVKNSIGTAKFATEHAADGFDLLVNVGDTSYADDYEAGHNAKIFDAHFNEIEGYAARMPFMACPGNHERQCKKNQKTKKTTTTGCYALDRWSVGASHLLYSLRSHTTPAKLK